MEKPLTWLGVRQARYEKALEDLLAAQVFPFDEHLKSSLPSNQGLYAIRRKSGPIGEYLHAGKSSSAGLYGRVWTQHFNGGGKSADSDMLQKVLNRRLAKSREEARAWIRENCVVQWIVEEDQEFRGWAEHYILAALTPIWGR